MDVTCCCCEDVTGEVHVNDVLSSSQTRETMLYKTTSMNVMFAPSSLE
jgi:hypothetical protein